MEAVDRSSIVLGIKHVRIETPLSKQLNTPYVKSLFLENDRSRSVYGKMFVRVNYIIKIHKKKKKNNGKRDVFSGVGSYQLWVRSLSPVNRYVFN